jgi:hypothetical protein
VSLFIEKPWRPLDHDTATRLTGQLGVYQLGDPDGNIVYIGYAGGRSLFGLRGELQREAELPRLGATQFRVEVNSQYLSRWKELLMAHKSRYGQVPPGNADMADRIGRIHTS